MASKKIVQEILLLEEHFLDQLDYRIKSVFDIMNILEANIPEIESFIVMLEDLTAENFELIRKHIKN